MSRLGAALAAAVLTLPATAAFASGLEHATEWSWARDGGRILNAGVVLGLVAWLVIKYGKPFFQKRAEMIAERFASIEEARHEAEARLAEYRKKLAEAEAEAEKIRADARAEGELIRKKIIEQAGEAADKIVEKAAERIAMETETAREKLRKEATEAAVALAEDILKKNLGPEDQKKLIKSYLQKVEGRN